MKQLLVVLLFFLFSFSSNAQMLEEGDTITQEIETEHLGEGHIDTVTQTTVNVEHKTTEDILHKDTGLVTNRYEGDMDLDWGGLGPASMPNCDAYFGTGKCGKGTSNSLTTFDQYVDISDFHIDDGGALEWELQMYHSQNNTTGYFQTKGYKDNILQWDTGQINLENTGSPETFSGSYDFAGDLDKVFIRVGGKKNYYFDNVEYIVNYNYITTTVETWIEIVQPMQMEETIALDLMDTYESATIEEQMEIDTMMEEMDMVMHFELEPIDTNDIQIEGMLETVDMGAMEGMFQDMDMGEMSVEDVVVEIEAMVNDIGLEVETVEIEMPEITAEPVEVTEEIKETTDVAEIEMETSEVEDKVTEDTESPKEEVADTKEVVENKPTKEQEQKQEKAKEIIAGLPSNYDPVAQITTLALVNALGPNIKTYQQEMVVTQPTWYIPEDIYEDVLIYDPLGNYISVRSNLQMEKMIAQQYE